MYVDLGHHYQMSVGVGVRALLRLLRVGVRTDLCTEKRLAYKFTRYNGQEY